MHPFEMVTFATSEDAVPYDYLHGNIDESISLDRYNHLSKLNILENGDLVMSFKDMDNDHWTKWLSWFKTSHHDVMSAFDVHRNYLFNEIIIESDYKEYEKNLQATKFIGSILEKKGFVPHYYYSGNKSIHISCYFNFSSLIGIDMFLQLQVMEMFKTKGRFITAWMTWLRTKMILGWANGSYEFDEAFIKGKHLIRSELSRNKKGYKTFLGYSYKELSDVPQMCNEENGIMPKVGKVKLSAPHRMQDMVEEFISEMEVKKKKHNAAVKESSLRLWLSPGIDKNVKPCVEILLKAKELSDGTQRAMFIISNELKRHMSDEEVYSRLVDWNIQLGSPVRDQDIRYRAFRDKSYKMGCRKIQEVLKAAEVYVDCDKCNMKNLI